MSDIVTEARKLLAEATPGPWTAEHHYRSSRAYWASEVHPVCELEGDGSGGLSNEGDAELIAAAPRLIDELCNEVKRLREESDEYEALTDGLREILTGVANALNGPPPALTAWSWHDLPEKALLWVDRAGGGCGIDPTSGQTYHGVGCDCW